MVWKMPEDAPVVIFRTMSAGKREVPAQTIDDNVARMTVECREEVGNNISFAFTLIFELLSNHKT